jgi:tetratricopeptide (TPR) repeat protein
MRIVSIVAATFALFVSLSDARSHTRDPTELEVADARVGSRPHDAEVWLARAQLRLRWGDAPGALADLDRARCLGANTARFALERGLALLEVGKVEAAEEQLREFLERHPAHVQARASRGRALALLGRPAEAARELEHAIEWSAAPTPELHLSRARALLEADAGDPSRALESLEAARARLGPLVVLESYALELEQRDGRLDAALARIERLAAGSPRQESWLIRRAAILEQSGRSGDAVQSLRMALLAIERLPLHRRSAPATARLEAHARLSLERLQDSIASGNTP